MIPLRAEKSRITEVTDVSGDYYIKENYGIIFVDASNNAVTVYVPDLEKERTYSVSKRDSTGNYVVIDFTVDTSVDASEIDLRLSLNEYRRT